ncbi:unnamed protein product [Cylindrotheca closterium]|uniref:Peptidase C14 caspase domain-containing protein n=1 Tax=Cylindrotheca closterium TaxID=2856 RepID=A0AAD2FLN1_9STRA|nr:unnamed protein product [Cylindrotheca closterium]
MDPDKVAAGIPATFVMISGSEDKQTSADVFNVGTFDLPQTAGKAGGACTSTLLKVINEYPGPMSWLDLLHRMRDVLRSKGFDQIPQLSASRLLDANSQFQIVPPDSAPNKKRAILIGINYVGQQGELSGCHNDVKNIKRYLIEKQGFQEQDMLILMDDGQHNEPTRKNIMDAFTRITQYSEAGDVVFVHYSGHGGRVEDTSGDEEDGFDETLIPVDFKRAGQIVDDEVFATLVKPMKKDVHVTVLMDCCHSGTALDLPYEMNATDTKMHANNGFDMGMLGDPAMMAGLFLCLACCDIDGILGMVGDFF